MTCREFTGIAMLCMMFVHSALNAQNGIQADYRSARCTITTTDGLSFAGEELRWIADTLIIRTTDGVEARVPSSSIVALTRHTSTENRSPVAAMTGTATAATDPGVARSYRGSPNLYLIPTAYPERPGDIRLGLHEIFFPTAAYGVAGYLTVQGGTSIIPDTDGMMLHATLKLTPFVEKHGALAVGVTHLKVDDISTTVPFILGTLNLGGQRGNYLTCGVGYQTDEDDYFMMAGLELPVSDHVRLMSELFLIRDQRQISYCTPGVRLQAGAFDIDLGVMLPFHKEPFEFLPWIGTSIIL